MSEVVRSSGRLPSLHWAAASRPLDGESVSGDIFMVAPFAGGVLVAVVDALGHGPEAAFAAKVAAATLERYAGTPVVALVRRCHEMLVKTRGVVASLASIDLRASKLSWAAVGNVEGVLVRAASDAPRAAVVQSAGVLGYRLPRLSGPEELELSAGDRLVFATDGIREEFTDSIPGNLPPPRLADAILKRFGKETDDALVLVAQFGGGGA